MVNGTCSCKDFPKALDGWCKHRLASAIARRTNQVTLLAEEQLAHDQAAGPRVAVTSETAVLAPYVVHIHGKPFVQYAGLLALAHARGLTQLRARFVSVTAELAVAEASAVFTDGRVFCESSDSTPDNVGAKIRPHFARMALTRAKSRTLRDALGVDMVALEELGD